ncbi:MAG: hypothetical protein Harvfovirus15_32 [Harvfovirus sp.]|uniref:VWFA domain-containing protein n=1 Tax=Harvfovirus sp. TaxID=2487768 RepID=A0A3G5A1J8_9VIRU|nr:MAG: hypothetical protein Harvfovirus15_32 [Harvfovirus sp.]
MENKDFSVEVLQSAKGNTCVIGWNRSLLETSFENLQTNVYMVIDNSGSMDEYILDTSCEPAKKVRKMDVVKGAVVDSLLAVQGLSKKTGIVIRVCLLSFSDSLKEVMPLTVVNEGSFKTFAKRIEQLGCGGSTFLGEALRDSLQLMKTGAMPKGEVATVDELKISSVKGKVGGFFKTMHAMFAKGEQPPTAAAAAETPAPAAPSGISKLVILTDGHSNGTMKRAEIIDQFGGKVSVCIGIGNASNYDADLLTGLSPNNTYGGFSAETIRQNFVGALFSMYTAIASNVTISFPTGIDFLTPCELKSEEGSPTQSIVFPDFHPTRSVVLAFKTPTDEKVALACEIKYFDVSSQSAKTFNIVADGKPDVSDFNTHIIEYCLLTSKFTKITQMLNMKFSDSDANKKNMKEQQDEIEKLFKHISEFSACSPENPIYEMWTALLLEITRVNKLRDGDVHDFVQTMHESHKQQKSGHYTKIMKKNSDYMSKVCSS